MKTTTVYRGLGVLCPDSWTSADPGAVILEAPTQTVRALIPAGPGGQRFIRLKVSAP